LIGFADLTVAAVVVVGAVEGLTLARPGVADLIEFAIIRLCPASREAGVSAQLGVYTTVEAFLTFVVEVACGWRAPLSWPLGGEDGPACLQSGAVVIIPATLYTCQFELIAILLLRAMPVAQAALVTEAEVRITVLSQRTVVDPATRHALVHLLRHVAVLLPVTFTVPGTGRHLTNPCVGVACFESPAVVGVGTAAGDAHIPTEIFIRATVRILRAVSI